MRSSRAAWTISIAVMLSACRDEHGVAPAQAHAQAALPVPLNTGILVAVTSMSTERQVGTLVTLKAGAICTTTLLSPGLAITSAHCIGCLDSNEHAGYWVASYKRVAGRLERIELLRVEATRSMAACRRTGSTVGATDPEQDLALLKISTPDPSVAITLEPGLVPPFAFGLDATGVAIHGAGCTQPDTSTGIGIPRQRSTTLGELKRRALTCDGDSGGPVVLGKTIIGITPGLSRDRKRTLVLRFSPAILTWIRETTDRWFRPAPNIHIDAPADAGIEAAVSDLP